MTSNSSSSWKKKNSNKDAIKNTIHELAIVLGLTTPKKFENWGLTLKIHHVTGISIKTQQ